MAYFPFMIQMDDKSCLIGGGGKVALRKAEGMLSFGARVTVIAPDILDEFYELQEKSSRLQLVNRCMTEEDLDGADVVIMATDDTALNGRIADCCKKRRILVNVVDVKKDCGFYFPAVIRQDEVVVAVSTGGSSPVLASKIKQDIASHLRGDYGRIAAEMGREREEILLTDGGERAHKKQFEKLLDEKLQNRVIRVGTRGSKLALIQTDLVIEAMQKAHPQYRYEKVILTTRGDRQTDQAIRSFGGKAVFVEEIEQALTDYTIDLAVHSAKDMPNPCGRGLVIAGALPRACVQDVLIYPSDQKPSREDSFVIGTGSLRRQAQILTRYPHARCKDLRGNIGTRLDKLKSGQYDAIILAAAGIERQGLATEEGLSYEYLPVEEMIPAAGQAIIAVETRQNSPVRGLVEEISDADALFALQTERAVLDILGAGCHEPVGVYASVQEDKLTLMRMEVRDGVAERKTLTGPCRDRDLLVREICE